MDWIIFLHVFTIVNKCLLFPLFWFKKNNSVANRLLALLILLPAVPVFSNFVIYTGKLQSFPHLLYIYQILINLFGPVYYFYCMTLVGQPFKFSKDKLLHLLPSILPLYFWLDFLMLSKQEQIDFVTHFLNAGHLTWKMELVSITPSIIAFPYMIVAAWKVYQRTYSAKNVFANLKTLKISYIREFIHITVFEILVLIGLHFLVPLKHIEIIWVPILGNVMYFYVIYKSYNYSIIFSEKDYEEYQKRFIPLNEYVSQSSVSKYAGSTLSEQKLEDYVRQLNNGFKVEKWHLDPELNLKTLSQKSNIPTHCISQTINQKFEKNFFDYVNSYRVKSLKQKLLEPKYQHFKLEELAYMCGFNSKAAFQRAFKKHVGMTPTEYRNLKTDIPEAVNY